jgi:hypothetical protein
MRYSFSKTIRILILLILTNSLTSKINAQGTINIRAGLNNSRLYDMTTDGFYRHGKPEFDNKPAYFLGLSYYRSNKKLIRLESSLNICSKFVSLDVTTGGIGSSSTIDADYKLYYADISIYPTIGFGDRLRFVGSIRPNIGLMFASNSTGTKSYWSQSTGMYEPPTSNSWPVTGKAEEFLFISVDLALNLRLEYTLTDKTGVLLECQYSKGLNDISMINEFHCNFKNLLVGAGVTIKLSGNNTCKAYDSF